MAKILLVEDDENLREIYQARLTAEGYEIVSAKNGEEALVVAKQEKPDLIIADIMMPRISGFEMLDILRNTEGMKHVRVIMLTALGQAEDKARADKLGADRYLVKSQVTLEDIVHAAADLLGDQAAPASTPAGQTAPTEAQPSVTVATPPASVPTASPAPQPAPAAVPEPTPQPVATPQIAPTPVTSPQPSGPTQAPANPSPAIFPATTPQPAAPTPQTAPSPAQPPQQVPNNSSPTIPTQAVPTPGVPPIVPVNQPQSQPSAPPQASTTSTLQQTTNAAQLANAVNNLLSGTNQSAKEDVKPQQAPNPTQPQQATPPPQPSAPRAFPTGAPTVPTQPAQVKPTSEPPKLAQPPANVMQPQPGPKPEQTQTATPTPASIAIKDKKSVEPLKTNQNIANSDLNDLLKKETGQDSMSDTSNDMTPDVMHQPGQVFMPTSGNSGSNDPNNIAL